MTEGDRPCAFTGCAHVRRLHVTTTDGGSHAGECSASGCRCPRFVAPFTDDAAPTRCNELVAADIVANDAEVTPDPSPLDDAALAAADMLGLNLGNVFVGREILAAAIDAAVRKLLPIIRDQHARIQHLERVLEEGR
jgi:hypothetical protein